MKRSVSTGLAVTGILLALAGFIIGCGDSIDTAVVKGQVVMEGKPLDGVMVYFMPDPEKGTEGGMSTCITDGDGRFEMQYGWEGTQGGAVIGWHCVTLEDFVSENYRGSGKPPAPRVPTIYMDPSKTPLKVEVKEGEQEVLLEVAKESRR